MEGEDFSTPSSVVVIGGGVAGTTCAAELASLARSENVQVTLIDPQSVIKACSIVAKITRAAFDVAVSESSAIEWCRSKGITFVQDRAVGIQNHEVHCQTGVKFPFSACCIATGAKPYLPPALRIEQFSDRVVTLRDTDSVQSLRKKLSIARRAIVVGSGGIAMELTHEIMGCELVWVMKGAHVGSAFFDQRSGNCLAKMFGLDIDSSRPRDQIPTDIANRQEENGLPSTPGQSAPPKNPPDYSQSQESTPSFDSGSGVGPEWITRRFEPVLFDGKGIVQTPVQAKFTELKGDMGSPSKKVHVVLESEIRHLTKGITGHWPVVAVLSDGSQIGCDLILAGTGVVPNVEWLNGSGVDIDSSTMPRSSSNDGSDAPGGVLVSSESLATNLPGVFAAGDCTSLKLSSSDADFLQMRLWSQAQTAGRACAQSINAFLQGEAPACAGLDFEVFAHATQFFNRKVVLLGRYNAQGLRGKYEMLENGGNAEDNYYVRAVIQNGRVRGALLVGEVDKAETFENLILDGIDVSAFGADLVDPSFDIEDYFD